MRTLELDSRATPEEWGRDHGESFRGEIRSLADIRMYLTLEIGDFGTRQDVLDVAQAHLPVLEGYDPSLYRELMGIAEGANMSPAEIVVVNHYTDLRDIGGRAGQGRTDDDGCSVVWARTDAGPLVAQTWDMHATAIPFVMMLHVPEAHGQPEAWLFSITGCLGMAGMNRQGVSVAINNLRSRDAHIGVVWPALVRRALQCDTAAEARDAIMNSPIGSGHHYLTADARDAFGIETSGTRRKLVFRDEAGHVDGDRTRASYIHTNHCLDAEIDSVSEVPAKSTTHERLRWLEASISSRALVDVRDAWHRLGSDDGYPRSVCTNMATPENPHGTATCGAIAMELTPPRVWAQAGLIHNVAPRRFDFSES